MVHETFENISLNTQNHSIYKASYQVITITGATLGEFSLPQMNAL